MNTSIDPNTLAVFAIIAAGVIAYGISRIPSLDRRLRLFCTWLALSLTVSATILRTPHSSVGAILWSAYTVAMALLWFEFVFKMERNPQTKKFRFVP